MSIFIISIISVHHLFHKGSKAARDREIVDIPVLHSAEVVHFHCES